MATGPDVSEDDVKGTKLSSGDLHLLQQPFVKAVTLVTNRSDLVLYAIKVMQSQQKTLNGERLLTEVEKLRQMQDDGETLPPLNCVDKKRLRLRSDGDSDDSELISRGSNDNRNLQTDGESAMQETMPEAVPTVSAGKNVEEDRERLQRKLRALRYENKLLKARQLCRQCRKNSVSITFLPCGHYSYCYDCGQAFKACPICQKTILADVKTFLA